MCTLASEIGTTPSSSAGGSGAAAAPPPAGAPPSNTAPANCNPSLTRVLLTGIDSLYVSYQGTLNKVWDKRLTGCKASAQSEKPGDKLQAQVEIGGHLFRVHEHGSGRFAYVISDNWFRIAVARSSATSIPIAYIQIGSEALLLEGIDPVLRDLAVILNSIAVVRSGPHVSRVDIRVDFVTSIDLSSFEVDAWLTRARDKAKRYVGRKFSGWSIGLGGNVCARLYDKLLELEKSGKWYMCDVWTTQGWDGRASVNRLEFQLERTALVELGVDTVSDLVAKLPALWLYCTTDWLRLKIPSATDDTPTRWPDHSFWLEMVSAWRSDHAVRPAARCRKERLPDDEHLFLQGFGGITSFMASRGITDLSEGFGEFIAQARKFHDDREVPFRRYVKAKVLEKGRRYGTIKTRIATAEDRLEAVERAEAYRRTGKGD
jgi:hypothetical protein